MGIDIYSKKNGETLPFSYSYDDPNYNSFDDWFDEYQQKDHAYIREAYFKSEEYPTRYLLEEAFETDVVGQWIPLKAEILKERLEETIKLAEKRFNDMLEDGYYDESYKNEFLDIYRKFVERGVKIEEETGKPMEVLASW
jgi:hypothetical protein